VVQADSETPQATQLFPVQVEPAQQSVAAVQLLPRTLQQTSPVHGKPPQQSLLVAQELPPGTQQRLPVQAPTQQSVSVWQAA
jgi:hypothetical protein